MFRVVLSAFFVIALLFSGLALASDQQRDRDTDQQFEQSADRERDRLRDSEYNNDDDEVYGSQLMTERERYQYREQLRDMQTPEQREEFRRQHHEKMQQRAKEKGKTLSDFPTEPMHKGDKGSGYGYGSGHRAGGDSGRK
ncbi:MAG TPA: hypothetical protein VIR78_05835 [Malonomonas sp.]